MFITPIGYNESNNMGFRAKWHGINIKDETAKAVELLMEGLKPIEKHFGTERIPVGKSSVYYEQVPNYYAININGSSMNITVGKDKKINCVSYIEEHKNSTGDVFFKTLGISNGNPTIGESEPSIELSKHIMDSKTLKRMRKSIYKPGETVSYGDNNEIKNTVDYLIKAIGIR